MDRDIDYCDCKQFTDILFGPDNSIWKSFEANPCTYIILLIFLQPLLYLYSKDKHLIYYLFSNLTIHSILIARLKDKPIFFIILK
jgi:hypothetical protein